MYSLQQEVDILKSKINRYESVLKQYPNCIITNLDYISTNDILISNHLNKVNKIEVYRTGGVHQTKNRIVLHAKSIIEDISIYSGGIDFCSWDYYYDYNYTNTTFGYNYNQNIKQNSYIRFANYHEELKALKISDNTIKNIEMYIYNTYLLKPFEDYKYNEKDYIPHNFKKILILNG